MTGCNQPALISESTKVRETVKKQYTFRVFMDAEYRLHLGWLQILEKKTLSSCQHGKSFRLENQLKILNKFKIISVCQHTLNQLLTSAVSDLMSISATI